MAPKRDLFPLLASLSGQNQKAIERLFGSVRLKISSPSGVASSNDFTPEASSSAEQQWEIGLGIKEILQEKKLPQGVLPPAWQATVVQLIKEYSSNCPQVFAWLGRGDFNPSCPPPDLRRAHLLHACRTAGRLKAKALRHFAAGM